MSVWVLIMFMGAGNGGRAMLAVEFNDRNACDDARVEVDPHTIAAVCVAKPYPDIHLLP
jgi:hypothetical protein